VVITVAIGLIEEPVAELQTAVCPSWNEKSICNHCDQRGIEGPL
jgi:hypothetical protein